jgi:hypothetical protein
VSRAQRSVERSETVRCRTGTVKEGGVLYGSALRYTACALHRVRGTSQSALKCRIGLPGAMACAAAMIDWESMP